MSLDDRMKPRDPQDYEETIYDYIDKKENPVNLTQISDDTGISKNTVRQWVTVLAATGRVEAVTERGSSVLIDTK